MGLDISAFSNLRLVHTGIPDDYEWDGERVPIHRVAESVDRMDGLPEGLYAFTRDAHLWWHAEHETYDIPAGEIPAIDARIARLRAGEARAECPGDLAVLEEVRPITETTSFRAGSYSGYNWWREKLCQFALDVDPALVWENPERFAGQPFVELINFSDADGCIAARTAAKLFDDFFAYADQATGWAATAISDDDERSYFVDCYGEWQRGFELAADHGWLIFH